MGTKSKPAAFDCYANAMPDEPMFVLLARDPSAPDLVELWASPRANEIENGQRPKTDWGMVAEAQACAQTMVWWRKDNEGKWRKPAAKEPEFDPWEHLP